MSAVGSVVVTERSSRLAAREPAGWTRTYLRHAALTDAVCALLAGLLAVEVRFMGQGYLPVSYIAFTVALPVLWAGSVALAGCYEARFIGVGPDEFRRVMNAAVTLTGSVAVASYALKADLARGYVLIAMPCLAVFDMATRYALRKRLHRRRSYGACMQRVVAVGHPQAVTDLVATLRRDKFNGLHVVAACLAGRVGLKEIAGVPVLGGMGSVSTAVAQFGADTVAVLACPEMNGVRLRELAWELEETGTDLCVAPALMDVAGPRTTHSAGRRTAFAACRPSGASRGQAGHKGAVRQDGCGPDTDLAGALVRSHRCDHPPRRSGAGVLSPDQDRP